MTIPAIAKATPLTAGSQSKLYIKKASDTSPWTADDAVPLSRELAFSPTGSVTTVPLFGEDFDRAVKTGKGGTLTIGTVAPDSHPVVDVLLDAADGVGPKAQVRFLVVNPDARAYIGYTVVESAPAQYDARGVFGYNVSTTLDGEYKPFKADPNDIGAAVPPTGVTITPDPLAVAVGATVQAFATVAPVGARQNVIWTSSNPAQATVSETGLVTGIAAGTPNIVAKAAYDQTIIDTVVVTVS
jgi:hypothetical protein